MSGDSELLAQFLDTMLPGDGLFPAASASAMTPIARQRLHAAGDLDGRLLAALAARGWATHPPPPAARPADVAALAAADPAFFDEVRKIVYLTYYEQPPVIAAIRDLGFTYNLTPLPDGYPGERFDTAADTPRHGRGRWTPTAAVGRVDLAALSDLEGSTP